MKDLNFSQILRFLICGTLLIMLIYFELDEEMINQLNLDEFKPAQLLYLITFFSIVFGAIIYTIYRAIIYPIVNFVVVLILKKSYIEKDGISSKSVNGIISEIDQLRWASKNEISSRLGEWAAQIHLLYQFAIAFLIGAVIIYFQIYAYSINLILGFALFGLTALIHHVRYKKFELKIL